MPPQKSHASLSQANKEQEAGPFPASKVTNGNQSVVTGSAMVSHSNSGSESADMSKSNQQRVRQIVDENHAPENQDEAAQSAKVVEQKPKRLIRFFSEVAEREDSGVTITDEDPTSP